MSDSDSESVEAPGPLQVNAQVTFYSSSPPNQGTAQGKKKQASKDAKEAKTKTFDFEFAPTEENYLKLLKNILTHHKITGHTVTESKVYPVKMQVPPAT